MQIPTKTDIEKLPPLAIANYGIRLCERVFPLLLALDNTDSSWSKELFQEALDQSKVWVSSSKPFTLSDLSTTAVFQQRVKANYSSFQGKQYNSPAVWVAETVLLALKASLEIKSSFKKFALSNPEAAFNAAYSVSKILSLVLKVADSLGDSTTRSHCIADFSRIQTCFASSTTVSYADLGPLWEGDHPSWVASSGI